jgi:hypothetical protein
MKKLMLMVALMLPFLTVAQDDEPEYIMYRNIKLTPKKDKIADFMKAVSDHNKKYHSGAQPFYANVWMPISGPDMGSIIYSIGPLTYADMDNRKLGEGHDEDWQKALALCEDISDQGFWRLNPETSTPSGPQYGKLRIRMITVAAGEGYRFQAVMKKIAEVYAKKEYDRSHWIFNRRGASNDGGDVAVVFGYNNWAEMDLNFSKDYEEVHGEGSWDLFLEEIEEAVEGVEDHLWLLNENASGNPE